MKKVDLVLETDDNITTLRWAKMAEKASQIDDERILMTPKLEQQALSPAAQEIVLEEIEGHLDDGEFEHPDC